MQFGVISSKETMPDVTREFEVFEKKNDRLKVLREDALEIFNKLGFPTTRHEEWKYTNLKNISALPLKFGDTATPATINKELVNSFRIAGKDALVIVFENGRYNGALSDAMPSSINAINLAAALNSEVIEAHLGKVASPQSESFVALNTAFINDGVCIHVQKDISHSQTVHFMHISNSNDSAHVISLRNLIVAEQGAKITVLESYHSIDNNCRGLINSVTEIVVKENAFVEHVKAQLDADAMNQVNFTQVIQEKNSTFDTVTVTLSGQLVRNNLHIRLNGVNCTSHLFGLYILDGDQVVDNHTLVDHAKPNCFSNELYKGVIGGKASGVFNGKIFVREDAQKTNAYQSNKNILLTDDAQMNTKPQLEIFADDVKCTHGATTGQMDEEALFYLRTRGIGEQSAKAILNIAFASDVLNNIKNEVLKENLLNLTVTKLQKNEY